MKTEQIVRHRGREIFGTLWTVDGADKSPLVIFSHGVGGCHMDFDRMRYILLEGGIASYAFDFCGGSPRAKSRGLATTEMTVFTECEDLSALIDEFTGREAFSSVSLFGGSMGGVVSALTAETYGDKIKELFLLFPAFCIADDWNDRLPLESGLPETLDFWGVTLGKEFFRSLRGFSVFDHIGKTPVPVHIYHGTEDDIVPLRYSEQAARLYTRCNLQVFPGEKHGFSAKGEITVARDVRTALSPCGKE